MMIYGTICAEGPVCLVSVKGKMNSLYYQSVMSNSIVPSFLNKPMRFTKKTTFPFTNPAAHESFFKITKLKCSIGLLTRQI